MCPDGAVYNIEVAGTHTYLIGDGVVVHNCHHATRTNTYGQILEHFGAFREVCAECVEANEQTSADVGYDVRGGYCPNDGCATGDNRPLVAGFTATLVRSDKAKLAEVWQPGPVFSRDIAFGIRHGYLLDVKGKRVVVPDMDMRNVKQAAGDFSESGLADELERSLAPQVVAEAFAEVADGRKGIGFAPTVDSAYAFAEAFSAVGVKTEVVHGKLGTIERAGIIARLADGATQFVWSVMALTEGFDDPTVDIAVIARATRHAGLYQQMVGRVLRPNLTVPHADRTPGLVLDVVGVAGKHHLASLIDLDLPDDPYPDGGPLEEDELADIENFDDEPAGEGGGFEEVRELYLGPIEVHDFDPLARDNAHAWGRTEGGIYFLTAGEHAKVFLVPDATPNEYSLAWVTNKTSTYAYLNCPGFGRLFASRPVCGCGGQHPGERGGWANGHRGLSMESALAWGVDVAQELGGEAAEMFGARKKAWRKIKDVTGSQKWMLHKSGGTYVEGMTKGEVSDEIDRLEATSRIDPVVAALQAMAISEKEMAGAG